MEGKRKGEPEAQREDAHNPSAHHQTDARGLGERGRGRRSVRSGGDAPGDVSRAGESGSRVPPDLAYPWVSQG